MIVIATKNANKLAEVRQLAAVHDIETRAISDYPGCPEVEEDGVTFEENAAIKAMKYSLWLKRVHGIWPPVLAEDAGLEIESLMGWPGVYSARIAASNEQRIQAVLDKLADSKMRAAKFVACTALAVNGHLIHEWLGYSSGSITETPAGDGGFGYDPIFFDPVLNCTYAQVSSEAKSSRSHRAKAWSKALAFIARRSDLLR